LCTNKYILELQSNSSYNWLASNIVGE